MEKKKRISHRRRAALNDLVERTGISRREAGNVLNGQWAKTQLDLTAGSVA